MPIGSFESAWENYDHTTGPALISEGKEQNKVGAAAPNWRLVLGTENFTRRLLSAEVTFSREGESGMRFTVAGSLRALQYERARVSFWFGYGTKLVPFFRGRLADPWDSPSGLHSEATAYGLKGELGQRYFAQRLDYGEMDLRDAFWDVIDRFGADEDRFDFWGTHSTILAKDIGEFGLEVSLSEALDTILEPMQFIMYDQPGGMVIVQRSHLASLGTDEVFSGAGHYEPEDYPKDGFEFSESMRQFYSDVVIFRRKDEFAGGGGPGVLELGPAGAPDAAKDVDEYDVYVDLEVDISGQFNVQQSRNYVVADYPGQQEHAEREAGLLKTSLERGVGSFTWKSHPIDFSIGDHFTVIRHEQIQDPAAFGNHAVFYLPQIDAVSYACVAEEITFTLGTEGERWSMTVSGLAFEIDRDTIREADGPTEIDLVVPPDETEDIDTPVDTENIVKVGADTVQVGSDAVVLD